MILLLTQLFNVSIIALIWGGAIRVNQGVVLHRTGCSPLTIICHRYLLSLSSLLILVFNITKALACAGRIESIFEVQPSMKVGSMDLISRLMKMFRS